MKTKPADKAGTGIARSNSTENKRETVEDDEEMPFEWSLYAPGLRNALLKIFGGKRRK